MVNLELKINQKANDNRAEIKCKFKEEPEI